MAQTIAVFRLDFGDISLMDVMNLQPLPFEFRKMKQLAMSGKLYGTVKPFQVNWDSSRKLKFALFCLSKGIRPKNSDWDIADCHYFQKRTENKYFATVVKSISQQMDNKQNSILELVLIDVSTSPETNINNLLVAEKRAFNC